MAWNQTTVLLQSANGRAPLPFFAMTDGTNFVLQSAPNVAGEPLSPTAPMPTQDATAEAALATANTALAAIEASVAAGATAEGQTSILSELETIEATLSATRTVKPPVVTPVDRSFTTIVGAGQIAAANANRNTFTFQVPTGLTGGLWISWSGTAGSGTNGSYFFPAGTPLVTLDTSVIGQGAITYFASTAGIIVPATEG